MSDSPTDNSMAQQQADLLNAGYRYALSLSGERLNAEDLVHELLFRTIRHIFIDNYRRERRIDHHHHTIAALEDHQIGHLDESQAETQQLEKHLSTLRDVEREALFLAVVEGYTAEEIAAINDCPRGTVLSLVHRAKRKLKASFAASADDKPLDNPEQLGRTNILSLVQHRGRK